LVREKIAACSIVLPTGDVARLSQVFECCSLRLLCAPLGCCLTAKVTEMSQSVAKKTTHKSAPPLSIITFEHVWL
jgi:hypothetical protein